MIRTVQGIGSLLPRRRHAVLRRGGLSGRPPRSLAIRSARGFTLLEVLIALLLSGVLMAGLWGLFATYEDLFSRGQAKVEDAQLLRALFEEFAQDLQCAIPDAPTGLPVGGAPARRFGLFGTQTALQVDVLRLSGEPLALASGDGDQPGDQGRAARLPDLHTVQYLFQPADGPDETTVETLHGLVRRELDWETPGGGGEPGQSGGKRLLGRGASPASSSLDPMDVSAADLDPDDHSLLWVPEVVGLEFRYYDGSGWVSQWNSLTHKSLPVAVEATLTLRRAAEVRPRPAAPAVADEGGVARATTGDEAAEPEASTHRLLVYLPGTVLRRPAGDASAKVLAVAAPPRPVYQPPAAGAPPSLPRGPRAGSVGSGLPEQWMRTGP